MLQEFFNDKSKTKSEIAILTMLIVVLIIAIFQGEKIRYGKDVQAVNAIGKTNQRMEWLANFDIAANKELLANVPTPVKENETDAVQQAQLSIFQKHGIQVLNASARAVTKDSSSLLPYIQCQANFQGQISDILKCLNEFESHNLVVINGLSMEAKNNLIQGKIDYRIIYQK